MQNLPSTPDISFHTDLFSAEEAQSFMEKLLSEVEFKSESYTFNGQEILTKRKVSYHSEHQYNYANQSYSGKPWTPTLLLMKKMIEEKLGEEFNAVLCNYYENGEAGMGWHSDKERELGDEPTIVSVSLGQERDFAFRYRKDVVNQKNPAKLLQLRLTNGSVLVMRGTTQKYFEHSLLQNKSLNAPRINLTFRKVIAN